MKPWMMGGSGCHSEIDQLSGNGSADQSGRQCRLQLACPQPPELIKNETNTSSLPIGSLSLYVSLFFFPASGIFDLPVHTQFVPHNKWQIIVNPFTGVECRGDPIWDCCCLSFLRIFSCVLTSLEIQAYRDACFAGEGL